MRISTKTLFENSSTRMSELQSNLMRTQQQISAGKKVLSAADDPVGAARALEISQSLAVNEQYTTNRANVKDTLKQEESTLAQVTDLLHTVKTAIVQAGNGALDDAQRKFIAAELRSQFDQLMSLANAKDSMGNYLFGGYKSSSAPFVQSLAGASYLGDQGQRMLEVGPSRMMDQGDSGDVVFEANKTGNGRFETSPATTLVGNIVRQTNQGTGVISPGTVVNAAALTGHDYEIRFGDSGNAFSVYDMTLPGQPMIASGTYVPGNTIAFDGLQLDVKGLPAAGDVFTVKPSQNQSIFNTLKNLIDVLEFPATGAGGQAVLQNGLNTANSNVDNALDNILGVRAAVGARLREIDAMDSAGEDRALQYAETLSEIQELDYTKAITELMQQQTTLQASQQAFVKISGLSLFNYI